MIVCVGIRVGGFEGSLVCVYVGILVGTFIEFLLDGVGKIVLCI